MKLIFETEQLEDGQWIAELVGSPHTQARGDTEIEAIGKAREKAERAMFGFP